MKFSLTNFLEGLLQTVIIVVMVVSCSVFKSSDNQDVPITGTRWILYTLNGNTVPNTSEDIYLEFEDAKTGRFTGFAGCNKIFGDYKLELESKTMEFENIGATRKACYSSDLENEFLEILSKTRYKINGHQLSFFEGERIVATFKAL